MSAAAASRYFFSHEVADILGGHELRALAEHTAAAFSIPLLMYGTTSRNTSPDEVNADAIGGTKIWVYGHAILWEVSQAMQRGYYQWHQVLADTIGGIAGLALVRKESPFSALEAMVTHSVAQEKDFPHEPPFALSNADAPYAPLRP